MNAALDRVKAAFVAAGVDPPARGNDWRCPAHDDSTASLSVSEGDDGKVLLHCHAGCSSTDIVAALRLDWKDLFPPKPAGNGSTIVATYVYTDETGKPLFRVTRLTGKQFPQSRADGNGGWISGPGCMNGVRRTLYRLPAVIAAVNAGETVWVAEGEKDVEALARAGVCATTKSQGAKTKWKPEHSEILTGANVIVVADRDDVGRAHAAEVAADLRRHDCTVRIVEAASGKDAADHLAAGLSVDDFTEPCPNPFPEGDQADELPDEPGHAVLDDLHDWFVAHVDFASPHHPVAVALWCTHTHALDHAASSPRIAFNSPEPESGKTRSLELMECVCHAGKLVLQMSPASVYRWVEEYRPTILLDELDAVFGPKAAKDHEDLRSLINAGHRPGATVPRVQTPSMKVVEFRCYCPVALAGIGKLPDTIRSRSIVIPMRRRAPDVTLRPFRERITRIEGDALRARLKAWVERHGEDISEDPGLPDGITDRQADQWEPLIAIADAAGGRWPELARAAAVEFVAAGRAADDQSIGIRLLADIRDVLADRDRLDTASIITGLCDIDDAPWGDWLDGKSDKARGSWLAKKLKPYGIRPKDHRFPEGTRKGYLDGDFADAWSRWLPPPTKGNKGNKGNVPASDVASVAFVASTGTDGEAGFFDIFADDPDPDPCVRLDCTRPRVGGLGGLCTACHSETYPAEEAS